MNTPDIEASYIQYRRQGEQADEQRQIGDIPRIKLLNAAIAVLQGKENLRKTIVQTENEPVQTPNSEIA